MTREWIKRSAVIAALLAIAMLTACGDQKTEAKHEDGDGHGDEHGEEEAEKGLHGGRLLKSGTFSLEITIFETGVPPVFRVYPYQDGKPVSPSTVRLTVALKRLGGKVDTFGFKPEADFLVANAPVEEPHSFYVSVAATVGGKSYKWDYESYEGRTTITDKAAREAGITTAKAGPALVKETIDLLGHLELAPGAKAELRARFPGKVMSVSKAVGDRVASGEMLARIESNESLQTYTVAAPFAGIVLERNANAGDVASDGVLFVIGDPTRMMADFHVFDRDAGKVKAGQAVRILPMHGEAAADAKVGSVSPIKDPVTQTVVARVLLADGSGTFLPGTTIKGEVVVDEVQVPLAIKTAAIQRFRDSDVVFAKVGQVYEVRMLEVGRRTPEWTEVLGGIDPGQDYVVGNSFLIKADIEKSGAGHDH
jgi:cobalt-zinc-cadmium efflux system membrane fusion protein